MLLYLAHGQPAGQAAADPAVAAHIRRLAWYALGYRDGVAFPGDTLFRLSMDLATGTAGVLLGVTAALSPRGTALPFCTPAGHAGRPIDVPGHGGQG